MSSTACAICLQSVHPPPLPPAPVPSPVPHFGSDNKHKKVDVSHFSALYHSTLHVLPPSPTNPHTINKTKQKSSIHPSNRTTMPSSSNNFYSAPPAFATIAALPGRITSTTFAPTSNNTSTSNSNTNSIVRSSLFHGRPLLSPPLSSSSSSSQLYSVRVTPHADIDPLPTKPSTKPATTAAPAIPSLNGHISSSSSPSPTTSTSVNKTPKKQQQPAKTHFRGPTATPLLDSVADDPSLLRQLSPSQLPQLAHELRWDVLHHVSQTGGHLGSSLGVIELTIALHYVFNTPHDRLIWDVSHQAYPHKILTGRRSGMTSIRQHGGLSGFTKRSESVYDPFGAGHSSTSISACLGMQVARDMAGIPGLSIAVIGDGAITGGQAYEAMNNAGYLKNRFVVIFNDNDQVSLPTGTKTVAGVRPSGALSDYTTRMMSSRAYHDVRELAKSFSKLFPEGVQDVAAQVDEMTRTMFTGGSSHHHQQHLNGAQIADGEFPGSTGETHAPAGTLFEQLGFHYFGIVDGHDLASLVPVLNNVRDLPGNKPVLVHVRTEKGKGYAPAEGALDKYHGVASFEIGTGKQNKPSSPTPAYTSVFASALIAQASRDDKVVALTAAMPGGTGLNTFGEKFPDKCHDVGIAEQHAVTMAGGMACEGYKPFCCIYSTFLQRGYDQLIHDVAIQNLPVRFVLDRAGLVGNDGPTHHGSFDLAYIGCVPNMMIMAPSDEVELIHMVATATKYDNGPCVLRYPRGRGVGLDVIRNDFGVNIDEMPEHGTALPIGKGRIIRRPSSSSTTTSKEKVAILSIGTRLQEACKAATTLEETHGVATTVADARFMKPLDGDLIRKLAREHDVIVTVEEGSIGGFGDHVLHFMALEGLLDDGNTKIRPMVLPDRYIEHGSQKQQYETAGLSASDIEMTVLKLIGQEQQNIMMEIAVNNTSHQNGIGKE